MTAPKPPLAKIVQELREIAVYVQSKGMGNIPQKLCKIADELAAPVAVPAGMDLKTAAQKFFDVTEELMSTEEMSPFSFASSMNDYMIARENLLKALKG